MQSPKTKAPPGEPTNDQPDEPIIESNPLEENFSYGNEDGEPSFGDDGVGD